jgi:hypothetical protein
MRYVAGSVGKSAIVLLHHRTKFDHLVEIDQLENKTMDAL